MFTSPDDSRPLLVSLTSADTSIRGEHRNGVVSEG